MTLYFIFNHLNAIVLAIRVVFLCVVAIAFYRPVWAVRTLGNISFSKLALIAIGLNLFYGLFVTWGQYYVWATSGDFTRTLLSLPLSKEAPLPFLLEWTRTFFEHHLGYFSYYVLGRTWLNILILFLISGALYFIFRVWKFYRAGFLEQGPEILLVLMLISGFPGVLVLIPLGFIFSILLFIFSYFKGDKIVNIEPVFILAAFFALLFTRTILSMLQ